MGLTYKEFGVKDAQETAGHHDMMVEWDKRNSHK